MNLRMFDAAAVKQRLPMKDCIVAMETAMRAVTEGTIASPQRIIMPLIDGSGYFGVMPGSSAAPLVYGAKIISLHPDNPAAGRPTIQGFVVLFDHVTGAPVALIDGAEVTAIRTAAASGLATRLLARKEAHSLGILGCGVQAPVHIEAMRSVRDITDIRIWARAPEKARAFVARHATSLGVPMTAVVNAEEAAQCDIVCTVTGSNEPILRGDWLKPGAHVNLIGAHTPKSREANTALMVRGRIYVDSLASAFNEAGDILIPIQEGAFDKDHIIGEIGALLLGRIAGRTNDSDITVYKSLGLVAQDLVAAHAVLAAGD